MFNEQRIAVPNSGGFRPIREQRRENELSRLKATVGELEAFEHRGAGSSGEKLAARFVQEQLADLGIAAELQHFACPDSYGKRILVYLVAGLVGLCLLPLQPGVAAVLGLLTLIFFVHETSGGSFGLSRIVPRKNSQNVVGVIPASDEARKRIIVCAHVDTQQTGWIWSRSVQKLFTSTFGLLPGPFKAPLFLVTVTLFVQTLLAMFVFWNPPVPFPLAPILFLSLIYVPGLILVGQWALGEYVPGANDNATGVAAAVVLAGRLKAELNQSTEYVILISGGEEPGLVGAATWIDQNQLKLSEMPTFFVNLDLLGCRDLHYLEAECALNGWTVGYPASMLRLCEAVAEELALPFTQPHLIPTHTDGLAFLRNGVPGITLTSCDAGIYVPNYHTMDDRCIHVDFSTVLQATEFSLQFIDQINRSNDLRESTLK